jgi:hypothetical protein
MSDFREHVPDDERDVPLDDEIEFETPPPTLDPMESVEDDADEQDAREREAAIEAGQIDPQP